MDHDRPTQRRDLKGTARRTEILRMLHEEPSRDLSVEEIAQQFGVSLATVRRDLDRMRGRDDVARTYDGVALIRPAEVPTKERETTFARAKEAIGAVGADLVDPGDVVILDAGSTTTRAAQHLRETQGITVVTNGVGVLVNLMDAESAEVIVLGGRLRGINETITGAAAEEMLRQVYAATAFVGTDAIDPARGIASRTYEQSRLKSLMLQRAARVVVLADSSKLGGGAFSYWSSLDRPWELVTDVGADPEQLDALRRAGAVDVRIAYHGEAGMPTGTENAPLEVTR